uniref:Uncharacterized protein n=1 Tax=Panagrolaimus sp. JU765 TaxID=591449 RepID=A0AC34Q5N1_9BILA
MSEQPPLAERLGAGISYTILTVLSTTANILVLFALYKGKKIFKKYPFYTLCKHLIVASLGELLGQYLVAIPLSFAGRPLYGNDDILIILSSGTVWLISVLWTAVTTVIGCPKIFRHDGFYYTYRCDNDTTDFEDTIMDISKHMSYILPAIMLIIYGLVLWKIRQTVSYRDKHWNSNGILFQSLLICLAFEIETVLFALLPNWEPTFGLFWLSLILGYMLILTASMTSLILLCLNPLIRATVKGFVFCQRTRIQTSHVMSNYRIYDVSDDYGQKIKEEKELEKRKSIQHF